MAAINANGMESKQSTEGEKQPSLILYNLSLQRSDLWSRGRHRSGTTTAGVFLELQDVPWALGGRRDKPGATKP